MFSRFAVGGLRTNEIAQRTLVVKEKLVIIAVIIVPLATQHCSNNESRRAIAIHLQNRTIAVLSLEAQLGYLTLSESQKIEAQNGKVVHSDTAIFEISSYNRCTLP